MYRSVADLVFHGCFDLSDAFRVEVLELWDCRKKLPDPLPFHLLSSQKLTETYRDPRVSTYE